MQANETAATQRRAATVSISSFRAQEMLSHGTANRSNEHNATHFHKESPLPYEVPAGNAICAPTCAQALFMIEPSFHSKLIDPLVQSRRILPLIADEVFVTLLSLLAGSLARCGHVSKRNELT